MNTITQTTVPGKGTVITGDRAEFIRLRVDTPVTPNQMDCLNLRPGTAVKTYDPELRALVPPVGSPNVIVIGSLPVCGLVHKNTPEEVIIIGHGWIPDVLDETFIWKGTRDDMQNAWVID